jgi:hypothetical protein
MDEPEKKKIELADDGMMVRPEIANQGTVKIEDVTQCQLNMCNGRRDMPGGIICFCKSSMTAPSFNAPVNSI